MIRVIMPQLRIKARALTGMAIEKHLDAIARLRIDILHERPDCSSRDLQAEKRYLRKYLTSEDSIVVIILDSSTLIGAATGIPLIHESADVQRPFLLREWDIASIFYLEGSVLLKDYQSRGIGHHFFDLREKHVIHKKKYTRLCFFSHASSHSLFNPFWIKQGFRMYPEIYRMGCKTEGRSNDYAEKRRILWSKELSPFGKREQGESNQRNGKNRRSTPWNSSASLNPHL